MAKNIQTSATADETLKVIINKAGEEGDEGNVHSTITSLRNLSCATAKPTNQELQKSNTGTTEIKKIDEHQDKPDKQKLHSQCILTTVKDSHSIDVQPKALLPLKEDGGAKRKGKGGRVLTDLVLTDPTRKGRDWSSGRKKTDNKAQNNQLPKTDDTGARVLTDLVLTGPT